MSAPPFDPNKAFLYMEDNGDGTMTQTMNFPEVGRQIVTVIPGDIQSTLAEAVKVLDVGNDDAKEFLNKLRDNAVDIPDNPDDIIGGT